MTDNTQRDDRDDEAESSKIYGRVKGAQNIGLPDFESLKKNEAEIEKKQNIEDLTNLAYFIPTANAGATTETKVTETITPTTTETVTQSITTEANAQPAQNYDDIDDEIFDINVPIPTRSTSINQKAGDELYIEPQLDDAAKASGFSVLSTPKARVVAAVGVFTTISLIAGLSYALSGDNKKLGDNDSGKAGVELKADPNAPLNEQQARYNMRRQQGEAVELAEKGVTNSPYIATVSASAAQPTGAMPDQSTSVIAEKYRGVNYRTADISKIPDNERLAYANSQAANGERPQYYQEPLTNTSIYQPKDVRGNEVLTYTAQGVTIKPDDYEQRLRRAMESENQGSGGGGQQAQNQGQNNNAPAQPTTDLAYENIKQSLGADYDAYTAERDAQQAKLAEQRAQQQQQAMALAQSRQGVARNALTQAIQTLTNSNNTGAGYNVQTYGQKYLPPKTPITRNYTALGSNTAANNSSSSTDKTPSNLLPKTVVRAGTSFPVVVTNTVNSDNGSTVTAQIVGGPFNGSKVFGQIEPQGRNIGVSFTALQPKNPRQALIPINAIALTLSNNSGVASKVNRHYFQNYLTALTQAGIEGYGNANANANTTTQVGDNGTVVVSRGGVDAKQVRGQILSSLANRLNQDIGVFANREPTFIIRQGTALSMTLVSNLDTTASTSSLNFNGGRPSNTANSNR